MCFKAFKWKIQLEKGSRNISNKHVKLEQKHIMLSTSTEMLYR